MGDAVHSTGALDDRARALVKLARSSGVRLEVAVYSHARKVLKAGCSPDKMEHTNMLALQTIGFPSTIAAFR